MNIILTSNKVLSPDPDAAIDVDHVFVCLGMNCWGIGKTAAQAYKNAKVNAPFKAKRFLTYVAPVSVQIDPVEGSLSWPAEHNAKDCPICTCGKGIRVSVK